MFTLNMYTYVVSNSNSIQQQFSFLYDNIWLYIKPRV